MLTVLTLIASYLSLFLVINWLHFSFFPVRVVLYDTVGDLVLAGVIISIFYKLILSKMISLTRREMCLSLLSGFLAGLLYAVMFPTVIDRSLSIYMLEKLVQRGGSIDASSFGDVIKTEFFPEHRLVEARLTEQLNSGTIVIREGCVHITSRGEAIVEFTKFFRSNFLPKQREILGQFTDDLVHPFRFSQLKAPYKCKQSSDQKAS